jgi:hypothetical protein
MEGCRDEKLCAPKINFCTKLEFYADSYKNLLFLITGSSVQSMINQQFIYSDWFIR